jgi:hypothetical protein
MTPSVTIATFGLMVLVIISAPRRPTSSCTELVIYNRMVISLCFHVVNVLLQQS